MNTNTNTNIESNSIESNSKDNNYVINEVKKIIDNRDYNPYPQNIALAIAWIIINMKGTDVQIFDMRSISSLADYYVLANAQNPILAESISDEVTYHMKRIGKSIKSLEGHRTSNWTLIDIGDVMAHIFVEASREIYNLEALWPNAPKVKVPESFYLAPTTTPQKTTSRTTTTTTTNASDDGYI
ncbi:MAG: ribosome silencing factor [Oligoflexia bacterium]|nr:ribosome silencing factor [Oligoflexia bacterium]